MASDLVFLAVAAGCWLASAYRVRALRRAANRPAGAAQAAALLSLGLASLMQVRWLQPHIDAVTGVPTTAKLLGHCLTLLTAFAAQTVLVLLLTGDHRQARRRAGRRAVVLIAILAALVWLLMWAPGPAPLRKADGVPQPNLPGSAYVTLYCAYLAVATIDICRMAFHYARRADRPFLRVGILLVAYGNLLSTIYAVCKVGLVGGRLFGIDSTVVEPMLLGPIVITAVLLVSIGSVLPAMRRWQVLQPVVLRLARLWAYLSLRPLWSRLVTSTDVPLLLGTPWRAAMGSGLSIQFLLQRRVTEISDALMRLRVHVDPAVIAAADAAAQRAGLPAAERRAVVEAASIETALRDRAAGITHDGPLLDPPQFTDADRKAWWLQQVAWALRRSAIVRTAVASARQPAAEATPA